MYLSWLTNFLFYLFQREINEVFEQYKLRNDESPTCSTTNIDNNTNNNKLFVDKTPCFLNGTNSEKKLIEISNNNSNSNNNNKNSKKSERSASSTTSTTSTTIITTNTINVSSNTVPKITTNIKPVTLSVSSITSEPVTTVSSRSSKITECNYKKQTLELQPEDNQLQPQESHLQNKIVGIGSNVTEITDDADVDSSASGMKIKLDINAKDTNDVKIWANKILKELDNLMGSDKRSSVKSQKDRIVNESYNWTHSNILKPEKHVSL